MAWHDAESYFLHRPLYPAALFDVALKSWPFAQPGSRIPKIADLACGTGQSVRSWLAALAAGDVRQAEIHACDVDPGMIARARSAEWAGAKIEWAVAPAEQCGYETNRYDAVSVLSAYHWLDRSHADSELVRILAPGGILLVAEYQFPTADSLPELNEWIRRNFNLRWKFEDQKPRGSLRELLAGLLAHPLLEEARLEKVPMRLSLSADELSGLLLSQARVLAWLAREAGGDPVRRDELESEVAAGVRDRMPTGAAEFDFRLTAFSARKRVAPETKAP